MLIGLSETGALYQALHNPLIKCVCKNYVYHLQGEIKDIMSKLSKHWPMSANKDLYMLSIRLSAGLFFSQSLCGKPQSDTELYGL